MANLIVKQPIEATRILGIVVKQGQLVQISSIERAEKLAQENDGVFELVQSHEPKTNKMLTKAKTSKYKSK